MDEETNIPLDEKSNQSDIKKRYNALVNKWSNISHPNKTLLKLLPVFVLLFATALTVNLGQQQQNSQQDASRYRKYHCYFGLCTLPKPTPTVASTQPVTATPTPTPLPLQNQASSTPIPTPIPTSIKYLATTGSDSNAGTITAPWANFYTALTKLVPGDTLYIRGGTYSFGGINYTSVAGTALKPIVITAYPGETVIFNGTTTPADFLYFSTSSSYVTLRGFTVQGGGVTTDSNGSSLIGFVNNASNITLESMTFNASSTWGSEQHLVYVAQNAVTNINVVNSSFNGNGCLCAGLLQYYHDPNVTGSLIQGNTFRNSDQGVMIWAAGSGIAISNNNFLNNRIAIRYHNSNGTTISGNTGTGNTTGILEDTTANLTLSGNTWH